MNEKTSGFYPLHIFMLPTPPYEIGPEEIAMYDLDYMAFLENIDDYQNNDG